MTKSELVEMLAEKNSWLTRKDSEMVVNIVFDSIADALKSGEKVESAASEASPSVSAAPARPATPRAAP